ncbi:MAG: DUF3372 domain-containing protein, partial [Anaerolineales bacterium]|nr:DUF3372 domain-containing protein [Anaerolineales bacterium]
MDRLRVALVGELSGYGNGSGYTADPQEAINYVSKHDNETLYDQNIFKLPWGEGGTPLTSMAERVRAQNMGLSLTGLAQGIPFFQMGSDMLRSKSLDRNSYDSGDWFNAIDWTYNDNNFAKGLPPAWDNNSRWPIMTPLLSDTNLVPTNGDILASAAHLDEILQIRSSSPLFRLQTGTDAITRIQFHNAANSVDGLIVMSISDKIGTDLDPNYEQIFVLFNADKNSHMFTIGSLAGNMDIALHPVQQASADVVVQTAVFDDTTGTFTVPARTTAVFVDSSPDSPSSGIVLDGLRDLEYGGVLAADPGGDLASPGPADSPATQWADLTNLYCSSDNDYLYVYADLPAYNQASASGQIGLLLDAGSAAGGTADPWGSAISFAHSNLPDYAIRGNVVGNPDPPNDNNGWTELRAWAGSDWTSGGTNWGGISGGGLIGNKIAYANNQGVEFKIPFSDIDANPGDTINLQLFSTQSGGTKGAYDTIPSDDQATGWDDATTLTQYVPCELAIVGNELRFGAETAVPDTTGSFSLDLVNADNAASGSITFTYDSTIGLTITGINATPRTSGFSTLNFSQDMMNPSAVAATIHFSGGTLSSGSGSIFDLDYTVDPGAVPGSSTTLDLLDTAVLTDSLDVPLTLSLTDGSFSIQAPGHEDETFVHLFEWQWNDIARECEEWLAPKGFTAVQVSPPMEHIMAAAENYPWWQRYQPVSYLLQSRSGTRAEFDQMVQRCDAVGVKIYVDAVINHMTGLGAFASGIGSAGTMITADQYGGKVADYPTAPGQYAAADFHMNPASATHCDHDISNFDNAYESYNCELLGLDDLDTAKGNVQSEIAGYLNDLIDNLNVAGLRIDAAKHMHPNDISAILGLVNSPPFVFQEVIQSNLTDGSDYLGNGSVTEFNYSNTIGDRFINGNIAALQNMGAGWLPTEQAVVFTDNHDNQRGHGGGGNQIVDHQDGQIYNLANIFMLAWPYGYPKVMSSYYWDGVNADAGPPGSGGVTLDVFDGSEALGDLPAHCDDGSLSGTDWICEHRRVAIANMVKFRAVAAGEAVTDWWDDGNNQIAYGRSSKGYVAINRDNSDLTRTFSSSMAAGSYCDITKGSLTADGTACTGPVITVEANGDILNQTVAALDAFAIMDAARIGSCPATTPPPNFNLNIMLQGNDARLAWLPYGGPYDVRYSTSDPYFATLSGTQLMPVPQLNVAVDENVTDIVSVNTYYRVRVDNCSGQNDSERVAVFNFGLVAGE